MPDFKKIVRYDNVIKCLSYTILILLIWASLWSIVGEAAVPPNGSLFTLLIVFVTSYLFGEFVSLVGLPPLLGMLIAGFIIGNAFEINLNKKYSSILRSIALAVILLRAGLGLDPKVIRKLSAVCLRLSFIPCLIEALTISLTTHLLLDFPLKWGFLLGFVLAAISPAVVVPGMITLQENQLGTDKGIPTLVIAAASIDDVIAITGFGVCLGLVFDSGSSLVWSIFKGPVEVLIGVIYGIIIGVVLWFIPSKWDSYKNKSKNTLRLNILLLSGIFSLFGSASLDLGGAGALGCLVLSFVAALKWRSTQFEEQIQNNLKFFWLIFQPFLFALIGAEVKVSDVTGNAIGLTLLSLLIGLIIRMITSALVVFGADLNLKEKLFISLAWLPKATVQAAIGPIALDFVREKGDPRDKELATLVLTIAVLSILITAPLGAIAISMTGPKLLNKSQNSEVTQFNSYTVEGNKKTKDFEEKEWPVIPVILNLERVECFI